MRIEALGNLNIKPELLEVLKNLEVGDIIKGRLVDFLDNTVTLKTTSGQTLTASLMNDVVANKGDFVQLMITNITADKIFAQLNTGDKIQAPAKLNTLDVLNKLGIPVNDLSIEGTELLLKNNMPVNKETLMALINTFKSTGSMAQSSTEAKLGLLIQGLDIRNTDVNVLNKISMLNEGEVKVLINNIVEGQTKPIDNNVDLLKSLIAETNHQNGEKQQMTNTNAANHNNSSNNNNNIQIDSSSANSRNGAEQIKSDMLQLLSRLDLQLNNEAGSFIAAVAKQLAVIGSSTMEEIAYLQSKDLDITANNLEVLKANIKNTNKLDDFLSSLQKQIDVYDDKQLKELKDDIKRVFVQPKDIADKEQIKDKLKDIMKLGEKIDNVLTKQNLESSEIRSTLVNLRENIDFIRHINQFNNYLQLPLVVNGEQSTADMYVFKDKKRGKNIDPQNATILLSLDLSSLGHLESLIAVSQKTVNLTFRLENEAVSTVLKKHSNLLKDALEASGYALSPIKYIRLEQSFNLLMLEDMMADDSNEIFHFDKRI